MSAESMLQGDPGENQSEHIIEELPVAVDDLGIEGTRALYLSGGDRTIRLAIILTLHHLTKSPHHTQETS